MVGVLANPRLLVVGDSGGTLGELRRVLPEIDELELVEARWTAAPELPTGPEAAVALVFEPADTPDAVGRWLPVLPAGRTIWLAADERELDLPGAEAISPARRDRLLPALARLVHRALRDPLRPSAELWERLLASTEPSELGAILADAIALGSRASWVAVLQVSGEASAFDVAGAHGTVPSVLHDCHDMTPGELAGALGWDAAHALAQRVEAPRSTVSRTLTHDGTVAAFATIRGTQSIHGLAIAGWSPPATMPATALTTITTLTDAAGAAIRHASKVADLRISERTKSEFVATMSHELRNPLSAILGYTDLLVHGDFGTLGEEQAEVLRRAHQSASSLLDLINATLDVSRFEVGSNAAETATVDLIELLREELDELSRGRRHAQLELVPGDGEPSVVVGDTLKLRVTLRQAIDTALAANANQPLRVEVQRHLAGYAVEVVVVGAAEGASGAKGRTPVVVELPEDAAAQGVPFGVFVAKRLLELIGASLVVWREADGRHVAFRMWIPEVAGEHADGPGAAAS